MSNSIYKTKKKQDYPVEIMLEIEPRCNFECDFCYNHNSFASKGRDLPRLKGGAVKNIIDQAVAIGVEIIRFTGGEPMLHPELFVFLEYAKSKKIEVRLNTNASLINSSNINRFKYVLDNVLIPIESHLAGEEAKITGFKDSLKRKVKAINLFYSIDTPVIRVGTVASRQNIKLFDEMAENILALPIDEWELYRPISNSKKIEKLKVEDIEILVNKIININNKTDKKIIIANPIPFCAIEDPEKLNSISCGAMYDDGHSRMVIDPRGYCKPHYFNDINLGEYKDIMNAWNNEFMTKMRELEFLPTECKDCVFNEKCRGGSRFEANYKYGKFNSPDPLTNFNNKKKYGQ